MNELFDLNTVEPLSPNAYHLMKVYRNLGYTLDNSVADIVDNSIDAHADQIDIKGDWNASQPYLYVLDNGCGMSYDDLLVAMSPGVIDPDGDRAEVALGQFGVGLKAASLSQANSLTVFSKKDGEVSGLRWTFEDDNSASPATEQGVSLTRKVSGTAASLSSLLDQYDSGTIVIWERLVHIKTKRGLLRALSALADSISLRFHRFLSHRYGEMPIQMRLNGEELVPIDPLSAQRDDSTLVDGGLYHEGVESIFVTAITFDKDKADSLGLGSGVYVYRNNRLISYGKWLGLQKRVNSSTKLSLMLMTIDLEPDDDREWALNVAKAAIQIPSSHRAKLASILDSCWQKNRRRGMTPAQITAVDRTGVVPRSLIDFVKVAGIGDVPALSEQHYWLTFFRNRMACSRSVADDELLWGVLLTLLEVDFGIRHGLRTEVELVEELRVKRSLERLIIESSPSDEQRVIDGVLAYLRSIEASA